MIIATVKKADGKYLDHGKFIDEQSAMEWFQPFIDKGVYGKPAQSHQVELSPAVLDEQGNELQPATYETVNSPAEFVIEFEQEVISEAELRAAKIAAGAAARQACQNVLDLIAGYNLDRALSMEQITTMQQTFDLAEKALRAGRPTFAKAAIAQIAPDGTLVTQEMKTQALALLQEY